MAKKQNWLRQYVAEFLGTFIFLLGGFSAVAASQLGFVTNGDLVIPLAFGMSLMVMVFALGHISGAHFNPAVTIGLATGKHFPAKQVLPYITAQVLGAVAASGLLCWAFTKGGNFSGALLEPNFSEDIVWVFEAVGTFVLVFVIASIATDKRTAGIPNGLAIGGTLFALALTRGWIGGGGFNPARAVGPAIVHGEMVSLLYLIAPILGGILAVWAYNYVSEKK